MTARPATLLRRLEKLVHSFGAEPASHKIAILTALERRSLPNSRSVLRLHEALCFLRAYPDDSYVLRQVERMLDGFDRRADLRRYRAGLADTGIAGTAIHYQFFYFTAVWLAARWPGQLHVDWPAFENAAELAPLLRLLVPYAESAALDDIEQRPRAWIDRWRGPHETSGTFLVRRFAALPMDGFAREMLYERLDPPLRLDAGPTTPSRSQARAAAAPVVFRTRPLDRDRPDLLLAARLPPQSIRDVPPRAARAYIDLARISMVTRSRDLDSFEHADARDVRLVDCGAGLQLACIGLVPERRALLDAIYGYLTLQNGMPIGYVLSSALFGSALVAYNIFETFRGAEAARNYGRVLASIRTLFGADTFAVDPYQLGHHNPEGIASGAWWFYYKLGFRPQSAAVQRIVREELAHLRSDPRHRSSRARLVALSAAHVFLSLGRRRSDILGRVTLGNVSLRISDFMRREYGADREAGRRDCALRAARAAGFRTSSRWSPAERLAWERWAPLVLLLPSLPSWSASERADLVAVIRAKGGRRESDYVAQFDAHRRLRRAVLQLAQPLPGSHAVAHPGA